METVERAEAGTLLAFIMSRRNETAMTKSKSEPVSSAPAPCIGIPAKARRFFSAAFSARSGYMQFRKPKEEVFVGYESSWPSSYKKLH
jgi:hypothetical protein